MDDYTLIEKAPTVEEYLRLREMVGWGRTPEEPTAAGMRNSLFWVTAMSRDDVIGCGRLVGDGGIYYYVQDIIVSPSYQKCGIGKAIMQSIMAYVRTHACEGAFVGLMAAQNVAAFYYQFGFVERPPDRAGMYQYVSRG
jgi:GNAT superfamily N-acetyltransferase